ncbi:MAG: replication-relaxation family protein [Deltaproteobacteria bacterium]|nr:replication-relaxation family protein [Deltaproteobacteria bacterium]
MNRRLDRREAGGARLTTRDQQILDFIERAQPVATSAIEVFASMSLPMARRRLRVLFDLGAVRVFMRGQEHENLYGLAPLGARAVAELRDCDNDPVRTLRGIGCVQLAHHAGVARFFALLTAATRVPNTWTLERFLFESEIRASLPDPRGAQLPDAAARLCLAQAHRAFAIEMDTGSEKSPRWILEHKLLPYGAAKAAGTPLLECPSWKVLFLVPSEKRRSRLLGVLRGASVPDLFVFFAILPSLTAANLFVPELWHTTHRGGLVAASPFTRPVITNRDDRNHPQAPATPTPSSLRGDGATRMSTKLQTPTQHIQTNAASLTAPSRSIDPSSPTLSASRLPTTPRGR